MSSASSRREQQEAEVLRVIATTTTSGSIGSKMRKLLSDPRYAVRGVRYLLNLPVRLETEDRRVLEQVIFPYFGAFAEIRSILFVGCDWYTKHYERTFFSGRDYWTIDPLPRARKFAGRQHVIAPLQRMDRSFPPERFDLILCNGVYGYGLDGSDQCERAFALCHSRLAEGGQFVLGWDDIPARTPVPLEEIASLQRFRKTAFPPLGGWRYRTDTPYRHTYDFYSK